MKILMVSLGDVCRAPIAQFLMLDKMIEHGLDGWQIDTAATGDWHIGQFPYYKAAQIAKKHGIIIDNHIARKFDVADFDMYDCIFVMDNTLYTTLSELARTPEDMRKVDYIMNLAHPGENIELQDPYWNDFIFDHIIKSLEDACEAFVMQVIAQNKQSVSSE